MKVRAVKDGDIARITEIYNWYILYSLLFFHPAPEGSP
jgi:L-amino acid N-acyltransferase YncA